MSETQNRRIAVVTGASRGIGRAVALACARENWQVLAIARAQKALEKLDDEIRAEGKGACTIVPMDLKDGDGIDQLGAKLYERFGRIDALASCHGVLGALTPAHHATPNVFAEVINVNLISNQRLIRSFQPLLRASEAGRAVFLSSGASLSAKAYWGPYAASKAGLDALVKSFAAECAVTPIRVNIFDPGKVRTAMRAKAYPGEDPETLPPPEKSRRTSSRCYGRNGRKIACAYATKATPIAWFRPPSYRQTICFTFARRVAEKWSAPARQHPAARE